MGYLWGWSKIMIVIITILGLVLEGYLNPIFAAFLMVLYVMFRGAVRGSSGITERIFWIFEISFILLLGVNVLVKDGGVVSLIPSVIGLYSNALAWIVDMALEGHASIYHGIFFILAIIFFENIGKNIGNISVYKVTRKTLLIGVPIVMFILFVISYGEGNVLTILLQLLPLLVLLFGFYIMSFGWSSSQRKR